MYKFKDKTYSLDEVMTAANESNLNIEDYISQVGITEEPDEEQDFLNPTAPGAVVGETTAPDMDSPSVGGSLAYPDECPDGYTKNADGKCSMFKRIHKTRDPQEIILTSDQVTSLLKEQKITKEKNDSQRLGFSNSTLDFYNLDNINNIKNELGIGWKNNVQTLNDPKFVEAFRSYVYDNSNMPVDDEQVRDQAFDQAIFKLKERENENDFAKKIEQYGDQLTNKELLFERYRQGRNNFFDRYKKPDGSNPMFEIWSINQKLQKVMNTNEFNTFKDQEKISNLNDDKLEIMKANGFDDDNPFLFKPTSMGWVRADIGEEPDDKNQIIDYSEAFEAYENYLSGLFNDDQEDMESIFDANGDKIVTDYERIRGNLDLTYIEQNELEKELSKKYTVKYTGPSTAKALRDLGYEPQSLGKGKGFVFVGVSMKDMANVSYSQNPDPGVMGAKWFSSEFDPDRKHTDIFEIYTPPGEEPENQINLHDLSKYYSETQLHLYAKRDTLERLYFTGINPKSYKQHFGKELLYSFRGSYMNSVDLARARLGIQNRKTIISTEFGDAWGFKNTWDDLFQEDIANTINTMDMLGITVTPEMIKNSNPTNATAVAQALGHVPVMALEFGVVGKGISLMSKFLGVAGYMDKLRVATYRTPQGRTLTLPTITQLANKAGFDNAKAYIKARGLTQTNGSLFHKLQLFTYDAALAEGTLNIVEEDMEFVGTGFVFSDRILGKARRLVLGNKKYMKSIPPFYKEVVKGGIKFIPGTEAGIALQAIADDLMNNKDFKTFFDETYGDEDNTTQRFITSFVSGMAYSGANQGFRTNTFVSDKWLAAKRAELQKKYTTDGRFNLDNMSAKDASIFEMVIQEQAIRTDTHAQSNEYIEKQWTNSIEKFKKAENIDVAYKFIRDADRGKYKGADPVTIKYIDGKPHMVLNTPKLSRNMMPHEYWHLINHFKIKDPSYAENVMKLVDKPLNDLLEAGGANVKFGDLIRKIYGEISPGVKRDFRTKEGREFKADEYFGNLLELLKDKDARPFLLESGFLVQLKNSMENTLIDLVAKRPKIFNYRLFQSIPAEIIPKLKKGNNLLRYLEHLANLSMEGFETSPQHKWLNEVLFEGNTQTYKGRTVVYNAKGKLDFFEKTDVIQQKVLEYKKGNPKALFELIDLTADITTNDKTGELINPSVGAYMKQYVEKWVKDNFGKRADGTYRQLDQKTIDELVSHTFMDSRGVFGLLERYDIKKGQNFTQMLDQHMKLRFMDIYKTSMFANRKLAEKGEDVSYDPLYIETKNRITFESFKKSDGSKLDLSEVLSATDVIVDKIFSTSLGKEQLTFMDFAGGPFNFESGAKSNVPMKLMSTVKNAFGKTTAERNANIKANIERIYEMIPESFDMMSQQSTQVIKGQSIFKEFFDVSKTERYPKSKISDNQPFKANKKQLKYDENGQLTPESQKLLDRFAEVLTEGRVDTKHTRLFNVMSQAIQVRRATDRLNEMSREGADIPDNIKAAAFLSNVSQSVANLKSAGGEAFKSTNIGQQLNKRGFLQNPQRGYEFIQKYFSPGYKPTKEERKFMNDWLAEAKANTLVKGGEGFNARNKKDFGDKYQTEWTRWHSESGWERLYQKAEYGVDPKTGKKVRFTVEDVVARMELMGELQKDYYDGFTSIMARIIPTDVVNASPNIKENLFSSIFNYTGDHLAGNTTGKFSKQFIEKLNQNKFNSKFKKHEFDFEKNPEYEKILQEGLEAMNSGKIEFAIKGNFKKKFDAVIEKFGNTPEKVIPELNKLYPKEIVENLIKFDKMMGVFYETYLNGAKNSAERLKREKHLLDHFQMQSMNGWSVRGIAGFTTVFIPPKGYKGSLKAKGEHMKSSSDFAYESWKDLIEGNYFKNYEKRSLNFEQSYGPEALWNIADNFGRNNQQGYDRFLANQIQMENTYYLGRTGKPVSVFEKYAKENFVAEIAQRAAQQNNLRLKEQKKRQELKLEYNSKNLSQYLNKEIFEQNYNIPSDAVISSNKAKIRGRENKKWYLFSSKALDAEGLIYRMLAPKERGEAQWKWWQDNFITPFTRADNAINAFEVHAIKDLKTVLNSNKVLKRELNKVNDKIGYKNSEAVRIYLWARQGEKIPGLTKTDLNAVVKEVENNPELVKLANSLSFITKGYGWGKPRENWIDTTLHGDILNVVKYSARPDIFRQWVENTNEIFSPENMSKMQYQFGESYVESWRNMLWRMETGQSRRKDMGKFESGLNDYITGGQSTIMFWNMKTAITQLTSMPNYINWGDNNFFAASKAVANIPQFAKDVRTLFMSDFAVGRRENLKMNVNEAELATIMQRGGGFSGVLNYVLKQGYTPTRAADGLAISIGGASMYRNRINTYLREGLKLPEAEKKAMEDWIEVTQENQQSSRADRISYQQASTLGKIILNFANTPMQYNRIMYKAGLDLINRRGDDKTNLSKIVHYGGLQATMFTALQQAVFALYTGEADSEDADKKAFKMMDSMTQTWLRGLGFGGAIADMNKQVFIDLYKRAQGDKYNRDLGEAAWKVFSLSPPISAKIDKLRRSFQTLDYEGDKMLQTPLDPDDPFYAMVAQGAEGVFNVPLNRALVKLKNIQNFMDEELEWYNRLFSILGYNEHVLLIDELEPVRKRMKKKPDIFGTENLLKKDNIFDQENILK